ncbi:hypothetical protein GLAREA_02942 [Glarea lozoyensis ATCC 20868]|uniref:Uncharacterized protein n=1 Tax=Glarea lozoyensis (strain ATCC 20868 / MF5171) TaxID=1116229 RepID=S3DKE4_GLAL2|nr:uncharacterized protein GLAREA_02942 [Glarea lozoyensis ATCC 20868]EPE27028.1 hypothetical protein GLAREA_02942 [Glarea lozoyensis ATCC 20868]
MSFPFETYEDTSRLVPTLPAPGPAAPAVQDVRALVKTWLPQSERLRQTEIGNEQAVLEKRVQVEALTLRAPGHPADDRGREVDRERAPASYRYVPPQPQLLPQVPDARCQMPDAAVQKLQRRQTRRALHVPIPPPVRARLPGHVSLNGTGKTRCDWQTPKNGVD